MPASFALIRLGQANLLIEKGANSEDLVQRRGRGRVYRFDKKHRRSHIIYRRVRDRHKSLLSEQAVEKVLPAEYLWLLTWGVRPKPRRRASALGETVKSGAETWPLTGGGLQ